MGRPTEKMARQHLGQKIGTYKNLFGAELHQLEELGGQMPDFEKYALKSRERHDISERGKSVNLIVKRH